MIIINKREALKPDVVKMEAALEAAESAIDEATDIMWRGEGGEVATSLSATDIEQAYYTLCDAMVPVSDALAYKRGGGNASAAADLQNSALLTGQMIEALKAIGKSFGQSNLLSTATDQQRYAALERILNAWNEKASPIMEKLFVEREAEATTFSPSLQHFEDALKHADWKYEDSDDVIVRKNGGDGIENIADLFATLDFSDRPQGSDFMSQYVPPEWADSWEKVLKNAFDRQSRLAAERAEKLGTFSNDPNAANYKSNFGYSHTQDGVDFFLSRKTGELIGSPISDRRTVMAAHKKQGKTPTL